MNFLGHPIFIAWLICAVLMGLLWIVQYQTRSAGIVDVAWAFGTGLTAVWLCYVADGDVARRVLIAALAMLWAARLGQHLFFRLRREKEDGRYLAMKKSLGDMTQPVFFLFFQLQALWAVLFALRMWAAAQSDRDGLGWLDLMGILIWLLAIGGEALADRQLEAFRSDPANKGQVCRTGLWRYSRHPNYFFEWLHWFAYIAIGFTSPYWWMTLAALVLMYIFLSWITGIPYTEQQALRSRGEKYREYQRTTNRFFPMFPRTQSN